MGVARGDEAPRYRLGFSSGSLLAREGYLAATAYLQLNDWSMTRQQLLEDNTLQARTQSSKTRRVREVLQRISELSAGEIALLADSTATERAHMMWVAACRRYSLIGEFAEEVIRERFLTLAETVTYADFDAFLLGKAIWHEEIADLKESTVRKLRANIFRMLLEAGLLRDDNRITPALLSDRVEALLDHRSPSDLRFFPTRQSTQGACA